MVLYELQIRNPGWINCLSESEPLTCYDRLPLCCHTLCWTHFVHHLQLDHHYYKPLWMLCASTAVLTCTWLVSWCISAINCGPSSGDGTSKGASVYWYIFLTDLSWMKINKRSHHQKNKLPLHSICKLLLFIYWNRYILTVHGSLLFQFEKLEFYWPFFTQQMLKLTKTGQKTQCRLS